MLGLADLLADDALAAATHTIGPHFAPKAKHVILLFMTGGPSQVDLWDPKPALMKYAGQRPATADLRTERTTAGLMPTKFSFSKYGKGGIEMSELLPNLATVADELCVVRSMFTTNPNHEQARSMFHQGSMILSRPSVGSWISYGLGTENKNLPAFMVLAPDGGGFTTAGFLPAEYQGTSFNTFETAPDKMIRFLRNTELDTGVAAGAARPDAGAQSPTSGQLRPGRISRRAYRVDGSGVQDAVRGHGNARRHAGARGDPRGVRRDAVRARLPDGAPPRRERRPLRRRPLRAGTAMGRPQGDRQKPARPVPEHGQGISRVDPRSQTPRSPRRDAGRVGRRVRPDARVRERRWPRSQSLRVLDVHGWRRREGRA